jgi:predicted DNA-binding transcriptional regulator AlpA
MHGMTPSDLLDAGEVASLLGVKPSSLRAMRAQPERHRRLDGMPAPLRMVSGSPVWERAAIERWLAAV